MQEGCTCHPKHDIGNFKFPCMIVVKILLYLMLMIFFISRTQMKCTPFFVQKPEDFFSGPILSVNFLAG
jgi:hypothetical protein